MLKDENMHHINTLYLFVEIVSNRRKEIIGPEHVAAHNSNFDTYIKTAVHAVHLVQ